MDSQATTSIKLPARRRSSITTVVRESFGTSCDLRKSNEYLRGLTLPPPMVSGVRNRAFAQVSNSATSSFKVPNPQPTPTGRPINDQNKAKSNAVSVPSRKLKSGGPGRSLIPTPVARGSSQTVSRPGPSTVFTKATLPPVRRPQPSTQVPTGKQLKRTASHSNFSSRSVKSVGKSLKRATSMESFNSFLGHNSTVLCITPSNSRRSSAFGGMSTTKKPLFCSKSSENLLRIQGNNEPVQKILKVPSSADKKFLNGMVFLITQLLSDFEYPKHYSVSDFNAITTSSYFNICQFLLKFMDIRIMSTNSQDETIQQLLQATVALRYPGTLTKSTLKIATSPHSWPSAVMFMLWLCCRVLTICTPRSFASKVAGVAMLSDNSELRFTDLMSEAYRRMFVKSSSEVDIDLDHEIQEYRKNISEAYLFDQNETMESITLILKEAEKKLADLESVADPAAEVQADMKDSSERLTAVKRKIDEMRTLLEKFKNTEQVESQIKALKKKIPAERERCAEVARLVEQQPFNVEGELALLKEVDEIKKQQSSLARVIEEMKTKFNVRQQKADNCGSLLYEKCAKFRIIDDFNDNLSVFEKMGLLGNMERIKRNPFNSKELDIWMKDVRRILRHTYRITSELRHNLQHDWKHDAELRMMEVLERIESCKAEIATAEHDIQFFRQAALMKRSESKSVEANLQHDLAETLKLCRSLETDSKALGLELEKLSELVNATAEKKKEWLEKVDKMDTEVEETYLKLRMKRLEAEKLQVAVVARNVLHRRNLILESTGHDILEGAEGTLPISREAIHRPTPTPTNLNPKP